MLYTGRCRGYGLRGPHTGRLVRVDLFKTDFDYHRLYDDDICLHLKAGGRVRRILPGSETFIFFTPQGSVCSRADHCLAS